MTDLFRRGEVLPEGRTAEEELRAIHNQTPGGRTACPAPDWGVGPRKTLIFPTLPIMLLNLILALAPHSSHRREEVESIPGEGERPREALINSNRPQTN